MVKLKLMKKILEYKTKTNRIHPVSFFKFFTYYYIKENITNPLFMLLEKLILVELDSMNEVHAKEVEILEDLYTSILEKDIKNITEKLEIFIDDVKQHFKSEEEKMVEYKFPALMKHKMSHLNTLMGLNKAKQEWISTQNPENLQKYFEDVFKTWLIDHLQTMDKKTAEFLKNSGCK